MIKFSRSTKGFYDTDINTIVPLDAVEITKEQHEALLAGQCNGKKITIDTNGYPILADHDPTPYDQLRLAEYPPVEEYLDAVVKGDSVAIQAYIDKCLAVKAKYPKP